MAMDMTTDSLFDTTQKDPAKGGPSFVGIQFCQECNNMLYPKEDKGKKALFYECRTCHFKKVGHPLQKINKGLSNGDDRSGEEYLFPSNAPVVFN